MDTSKYGETTSEYVGEALLFSGRKNPTWPVDAVVAARVEEIWSTLEASTEPPSQTSTLGYQGCRLRHVEGCCWLASQGRVQREFGATKDYRLDNGRKVEKLILSTAPPGLVPAAFLPRDFNA